jgi:hypothetical protein
LRSPAPAPLPLALVLADPLSIRQPLRLLQQQFVLTPRQQNPERLLLFLLSTSPISSLAIAWHLFASSSSPTFENKAFFFV